MVDQGLMGQILTSFVLTLVSLKKLRWIFISLNEIKIWCTECKKKKVALLMICKNLVHMRCGLKIGP